MKIAASVCAVSALIACAISIGPVDAQQQLRKGIYGADRLDEKTLRQFLNTLQVQPIETEFHSRHLARVLAPSKDDATICSKCDGGGLGDAITALTGSGVLSSLNTTAAAVSPVQCISGIITFLFEKLFLSIRGIIYDIFLLLSGILVAIPCLVSSNIAVTERCEGIYTSLYYYIVATILCLVLLRVNLVEGIITCGNPIVFKTILYNFLGIPTKDEARDSLLAAIRGSGKRHRHLISGHPEMGVYSEHIDTLFELISDEAMRFLVDDADKYMDNDSGNIHDVTRRYLQSTSLGNTTMREMPKMIMESDSVQKFIDVVSTNSTAMYGKNDLSYMLDMLLSKFPYDPKGMDAKLNFNFNDENIDKLNKFSSLYFTEEHDRHLAETECSVQDRITCIASSFLDTASINDTSP